MRADHVAVPEATPPTRLPRPVAFLDESYEYSPDGSREPVYVLAAVIIDGRVDEARTAARALVAPEVEYHTTELYQQGRVEAIHAMLTHVREQAGWSVVAIKSPYEGHADLARQRCLRELLVDLSGRKVSRAVLDSRIQPAAHDPEVMNKQDLRTVRSLRSDGLIHRHFGVSHVTDAEEPLLWLPDGVAWSVRRALAVDDNDHYELVRSVTTLLIVD
ncbi:MAG: hypothetical protein Q7J48_01280 [Nocardioides sp.]|nr:hypothetical protein [Nocardioides sp.]